MDAQQETGEEGGDRGLWGGEREESERKKTVLRDSLKKKLRDYLGIFPKWRPLL